MLAPADPNGSADELAKALADAGQHLSDHPVSAVSSQVLGPASVRALAALAAHFRDRRATSRPANDPFDVDRLLTPHDGFGPVRSAAPPGPPALEEGAGANDAEDPVAALQAAALPTGQLIIAIPSVLSQPLGIAVARAADFVLLAVELGETRLADVSRSTDVIGREHILGTCLVSNR